MPISDATVIANRLIAFRTNAMKEAGLAQKHLADQMLTTLKQRTSREFQTVPTYIHDPLAKRRYPAGTIPFFAIRAKSIGRTPWVGRVQLYARGPHVLHDELTVSQSYHETKVTTDIGYPAGVERGKGRYILWVYFGTVKMQPRPFLHVALAANRKVYLQRMAGALNRAIRRA